MTLTPRSILTKKLLGLSIGTVHLQILSNNEINYYHISPCNDDDDVIQ